MLQCDYLIVGAGLFGATFARKVTDAGKKCVLVDRRSHLGGNCYSESRDGIDVHMYGPHIFHTNSVPLT
jgi:UDP-galactopyranose mutase